MPTCPICGGQDSEPELRARDARTSEEFEARRCHYCLMVYTDPRPEDVARYYGGGEDYYAYRETAVTDLERLRLGMIARIVYREIARRPPGILLDVGSGSGRLTRAFGRLGWRVRGIDPSDEGVAAAAVHGIDVHLGTIHDELPWAPGTFDAVIFNHSLEHVSHPIKDLRRAREMVVPGGLVGVTVPNFASWERRAFGASWLQLDMPRHLNHFEPITLGDTAHRAGLRVRRLSTTSMSASPTASVMDRMGMELPARLEHAISLGTYPALAATGLVSEGNCLNLIAAR